VTLILNEQDVVQTPTLASITVNAIQLAFEGAPHRMRQW
jgi:hypothetical protein